MIKRTRKNPIKRKRKNPDSEPINIKGLEEIGNDIKNLIKKNSIEFSKAGVGDYAEVYKFRITKNILINTEILKKGTYAIKIYFGNELYSDQIRKLILLSKNGLIPKIHIITPYYIIMNFIDGYDLCYIKSYEFRKNFANNNYWDIRNYIDDKLKNLNRVWEKLGFQHGDLNCKNIIISKNLKNVYLIDPWV